MRATIVQLKKKLSVVHLNAPARPRTGPDVTSRSKLYLQWYLAHMRTDVKRRTTMTATAAIERHTLKQTKLLKLINICHDHNFQV